MHGSELNQVWTNILDNALGALGEDGKITITTLPDNGCIRVDIADDGPGIPEDVRRAHLRSVLHHQGPGRRHRAWGWTRRGASSSSVTAARSRSTRATAARRSTSGCLLEGRRSMSRAAPTLDTIEITELPEEVAGCEGLPEDR